VVANRLVLVAPESAALPLTRVEDLAAPAVRRVALGEPATVPAGTYARLFLEERGLWRPLAAKWVPLDSVRAVLAAVESGNVDAGFVYQTDARRSRRVRVVGGPLEGGSLRIVHPGAVVSGSTVQAAAAGFLDYLREEAAVAVLQREGFLIPEAPAEP
jgi:molybdate transport system substrate-binding protein